ncbi:cytochrome P450 [Actinomadura viridis]|uniref:cytochrome P450 n=1 Tax=Actinomadura viridis TaxID=58110 RepID=UPI0036AF50B9
MNPPKDAAGCPALRNYDPFESSHLADPYPLWSEAQEHAPFYAEKAGFWVVTRYADVLQVTRDTKTFSSRESLNFKPVPAELRPRLPHGFPQAYPSLINTDPPEHARIRKIANRTLTPRYVEKMLPSIERIANRLIDAFVDDGRADIVSRFAVPLPVTIIADFLGVPASDQDTFQRWSDDAFLMANPTLDDETFFACATSMAELNEYLGARIAERREAPRDDLLSRLIHETDDESRLSNEEIISTTAQLLIGGNVTTSDLLGNILIVLLSDLDRLRYAQDHPDRLTNIIEEVLRYKSSIRGLFRHTTRDVEVGGALIPAGATVWVVFGAANHDRTVFPEPSKFDPERDNLTSHIAFGRGTHFCIGAPLARAEARVALRLLLDRLPNLRLVEGQKMSYPPSPISAGVDELLITWGA